MIKNNTEWTPLEAHHIIDNVHSTSKQLKIEEQGTDPGLVGTHLLRNGGAMVIKLHSYGNTTIMKMGRWKSFEFLQYIHNQIAHLLKDISQKHIIVLLFVNVAAL